MPNAAAAWPPSGPLGRATWPPRFPWRNPAWHNRFMAKARVSWSKVSLFALMLAPGLPGAAQALSIEDALAPPPGVPSPRSALIGWRVALLRPQLAWPGKVAGACCVSGPARAERSVALAQMEAQLLLFEGPASLWVGGAAGYLGSPEPAGPSRVRGLATSLSLAVRFDGPARRGRTPWVPFARVGHDRFAWMVQTPGLNPRGIARGWLAAAGLALRLDPFDPHSARRLDLDWGINHTSVFVEWVHHQVEGAGLRLRAGALAGGLSFEF